MKSIPGFPDYFADELGNIYSMKPLRNTKTKPTTPRKLKPSPNGTGYLSVGLSIGEKLITRKVHHLILNTFVGNRTKGMEACHGIKGKLCNSIDNLSWGTHSQNMGIDTLRDGTSNAGERSAKHKLNELQVRIIRRAYARYNVGGLSSYELGRIFNVSAGTTLLAAKGKSWRHL